MRWRIILGGSAWPLLGVLDPERKDVGSFRWRKGPGGGWGGGSYGGIFGGCPGE